MMIGLTIIEHAMEKVIIKWCLFVVTMCIVSACSLTMLDESVGSEVVFTAVWADGKETRTFLQSDGTSVWWSPEEKISVFFGGYATEYSQTQFSSTNTSPAKVVDFRGYLPIVLGSQESQQEAQVHWAVYPYDATDLCYGNSVILTVPSRQEAASNTFADKTFPSIAVSRDFTLAFYNVCGGVRFSVTRAGIQSVEFKSVAGEAIAGRVQVGFNSEGLPEIQDVLEGQDAVTMTAPDGGFVPGVYYFATLLPKNLTRGITAIFHKGNTQASVTLDKEIVINRSRFGKLDQLDKDLEFSENQGPSGPITFADPLIKASLLAAGFDTDGDGEISYGEAAAVTSVEGVFTEKEYVNFEEFKYFTGIKELPAACFSGNTQLRSISLPDGLTRIGNASFGRCSVLSDIHFPSSLKVIGEAAFSGCGNLRNVHLEDVSTWLNLEFEQIEDYHYLESWPYASYPFFSSMDGHLFNNDGLELRNLEIPAGVTVIPEHRFFYCTGLVKVTLPAGLRKIGDYAFEGCNVRTVDVPSVSDWLAIDFKWKHQLIFYSYGGTLLFSGEEATVVIIPEVDVISNYAFYRCNGIERFVMTSPVPPYVGSSSLGIDTPIYVPEASYNAYCEAWPDLADRIFANGGQ